ncbi:MAG: hypothetical protein HY532_01100 [Chloroflexi bacterium]|nr:hypothetical protein [Chloroflexota bacterium]
MIYTFLTQILKVTMESDFNAYWNNIQRAGPPGTPTADEARRDHRSIVFPKDMLHTS